MSWSLRFRDISDVYQYRGPAPYRWVNLRTGQIMPADW